MDWESIPEEVLAVIAYKLDSLESFTSLSAVCKTWKSSSESMEDVKLFLFHKNPWLLLAEDTGADLGVTVTEIEATKYDVSDHDNEDEEDDEEQHHDDDDDEGEEENDNEDDNCNGEDNRNINEDGQIISNIGDSYSNISSVRGLFSIVTQKIYSLDLPEATDKLILGTNKGWLVTLGKDLEINLLHPLLRRQISLPPMLTFPSQYEYDDDFQPQEVYDMFVTRVVMSSMVSVESLDTNNLPMIMAIYGEFRILGFARLGDKSWKNVETPARLFEDVVYHKKKFYAVNYHGGIYVCDIDKYDIRERQLKGIEITSIPMKENGSDQSYLIEALSGTHIWLALRSWKGELFKDGSERLIPGKLRYYTSHFSVFKLEIQYANSDDIPSCTWTTQVKDLGNEALFIGRNSSVSIASSEFIKPNSIYFTDDMEEIFLQSAGGHDMGIFNVETGTITPHFQGMSIHRVSPPLWYI